MKDFLTYLVTNLVDHPDQVEVTQQESEYGYVTLEITVHEDDMGRIIGKQGRTIESIRKLIKVKAIKQGKRVQVVLDDAQNSQDTSQADPTSQE